MTTAVDGLLSDLDAIAQDRAYSVMVRATCMDAAALIREQQEELNYLNASDRSIRAAAIEQCAKVCEGEEVDAADTGEEADRAYNTACNHCAGAIRGLVKS